jgi:hypothetical protein
MSFRPPRPVLRCLASVAALTIAFVGFAGPAEATNVSIGVSIAGEIQPGVYGRIDIGNRPPPVLVYPQPIVIAPAAVVGAPVYLHVPPGHAKNWGKHCRKYNACGTPVYFVRSAEYDDDHRGRGQGRGRD